MCRRCRRGGRKEGRPSRCWACRRRRCEQGASVSFNESLNTCSNLTNTGRRHHRRSRPSPATCSECSRPPLFQSGSPPVLHHSWLGSDSGLLRTSRMLLASWRTGRDSKRSAVELDALPMSCTVMRRLLVCDLSQTRPSPRRPSRNAARLYRSERVSR